MQNLLRSPRYLACALFLGALLLIVSSPHLWAQTCPTGDNLAITSPTASTYYLNLGVPGVPALIYWQSTVGTPSGWQAPVDFLDVYPVGGSGTGWLYHFSRMGGMDSDGSANTNWPANLGRTPDGTYEIAAEHYWVTNDGHTTCSTYSPHVTVRIANQAPLTSQWSTADELTHTCSCVCDAVYTGSVTHPLTGSQSWEVPVTAWYCHGKRYELALSYNSLSLVDPQGPPPPELTGLSEHNSKWSHPFCQWIDLFKDEHGTLYAVWRHDGTYLSFPYSASASRFLTPDSSHTLTAGATAPYPETYTCNGASMPGTATTYSSFSLKDAAQTEYDFSPQYWTSSSAAGGNCQAIPHYLLTQIKDRWNRTLAITWTSMSVNGNTEPRVTSVRDDKNTGLTLSYTNGRLTSVLDSQNRSHSLGYSAVADENGTPRQKLTSVTVYGPSSPNRVVYPWSFLYQAPNDPINLAYGGKYTGDLVVQKTAPDGLVTSYQYEPVTLAAPNNSRPTPADWDGRATQVSWPDSSEGTLVTRTISRVKNSASQATLTFTGGNQVQYNYTGVDLTSVTDLATARTSTYQYDAYHNLWKLWTPLEATSSGPLVEYDNAYDASGHMTQSIQQVLLTPGGVVGNMVTTLYNSLNLPTQITAAPAAGSSSPPLVTQFQYDGGTLSRGNLTAILRGYNNSATPPVFYSQDQTSLSYGGITGTWGLPDMSLNDVGGVSTFTYDQSGGTGRLLSTASPYNYALPSSYADFWPSITGLYYNSDGLPSMVSEPMGHSVAISYNVAAPGSSNRVVTRTYTPSSSPRTQVVVLDPMGRVLMATDENGISTAWTYNPQGQVKTVTEGISVPPQPEQRTTTYHYSASGDLSEIDLPNGGASHVNFDDRRYDQNGNLVYQPNTQIAIYEGQVTKITHPATADYPNGTVEYFSYDPAGELAWHKKADGSVVTVTRDVLHRVSQVAYPSSGSSAAFNVSTAFDEFGRITNTTDAAGTTMRSYDVLSRIASITPPAPQQSLSFNYDPNTTENEWTIFVTAGGTNTYGHYLDSKGRLKRLGTPFNASVGMQYDLDGKRVLTTFPNGVHEERSYTQEDWLASILYRQANGAVHDSFAYYYTDGMGGQDLAAHVLREIDAAGDVHAFHYDNLYELVKETDPSFGNPPHYYTYDPNGNRTSQTTNGATDFYGVDANDKLQWVNRDTNTPPTSGQAPPYTLFSYDADGRTTYRERKDNSGLQRGYTFAWDGDDRLRGVTASSTSYLAATYNGDGLRITKTDPWTGTHDFSWGPGGVLFDDNNGGSTYTPGYARRQGSTDRFLHSDWIGSTRYLSDSTGNAFPNTLRFDAFGNHAASGGLPYDPIDFQFAGAAGYQTEYADSSTNEPGVGLQYLQQRYYDPVVGRFISQDPIGLAGGLNLYGYVGNDPVNGADPSGLDPSEPNHAPGVFDPGPIDSEEPDDPEHIQEEPGSAPVVEPEFPGTPGLLEGKIVEGSGVIRFDASMYRAFGMTPPPINMAGPRGSMPLGILIDGLPADLRAEFAALAVDLPGWLPANLNVWAWLRTPAENQRCRRYVQDPGHHRHGIAMGGPANPPEGTVPSGETRASRNGDHRRVSSLWYRVWRFVHGAGW